MKRAPWTLFSIVMFLSLSLPAWAQDFYVIAVGRKLKNVVTVAKSGGQYTDVKTAIDSIGDASPDNPYLVYIGPGVYSVISQIQLKAHVTVMGSGRETTLLRGAISAMDSAIILGADNATLTKLKIENIGGGLHSVGIYNSNASPVLEEIAVTATGSIFNRGVWNNNSSPTMINVTASASGGSTGNRGIDNESSSPIMINVTATGAGDSEESYGVRNYLSSPTIRNCTLEGSGYSIYTINSSPRIYNSIFSGSIGGNGDIYISYTMFNGGMEGSLNYHCIGNYGTTFEPVTCP